MNCDLVRERIDEYAGGALDAQAAAAVLLHLEGCAACRAEEARARLLVRRTTLLSREIDPPRDLWDDIALRIGGSGVDEAPGASRLAARPRLRRPSLWSWPVRLAATAAVLAVGALGAILLLRDESPLTDGPVASAPEPAAAATLDEPGAWGDDPGAPPLPAVLSPSGMALAELAFREARQQMRAALEERRAVLSPETVTTVDLNIRILERAIREIEHALETDPGNRELQKMLVATRQREMALLRQVAHSHVPR
jgi:hypothetical protein